ncbi:secreted protein [Melampsora americana]|nr:secreted protein [Melampsora americana]
MFKLQSFVLLAFVATFCAAHPSPSQLTCGSPSNPIVDASCKTALQQLEKYVKDGYISREESAFQVSCSDCKLTIGTPNGMMLHASYEGVKSSLHDILNGCAGRGSSVTIDDGTSDTNTSPVLTISYPTTHLEDGSCSVI